jgi:hypothetical protein
MFATSRLTVQAVGRSTSFKVFRSFTSSSPVLGEQYDVVVIGTCDTIECAVCVCSKNEGRNGWMDASLSIEHMLSLVYCRQEL